eukprot:gnl/Spiro4/8330_TR4381_c0_g1_i1.p1 gnl/Spiro4/8330_TR4381_c0_g1~~gnl/Spiro4/8330_TR4381_c0_g1_i1.p1  ORF type:complete len:479 (-),score=134.34 gnl/Spiro4/8330_TR4381_c0_g1_i1:68-1504(-)
MATTTTTTTPKRSPAPHHRQPPPPTTAPPPASSSSSSSNVLNNQIGAGRDRSHPYGAKRLTARDLPLSHELLQYYRDKLEEGERERSDFIAKLDEIEMRQNEAHQLRWELRKRSDEVRDLQKALSDAQQFLHAEREKLLAAYAENDELKVNAKEDRARIKQLLDITQAASETNDLTFFDANGKVKKIIPRNGRGGGGAPTTTAVTSSLRDSQNRTTAPPPSSSSSGPCGPIPRPPVVATPRPVQLPAGALITGPNEKIESLMVTINALRNQLEEQRQLYQHFSAATAEDRQIRAEEEDARAKNDSRSIMELNDKLAHTEKLLRNSIKDQLVMRNNGFVEHRQLKDALAAAEAENERLRQQLAQTKASKELETQIVSQAAETESKRYVDYFRQQMVQMEEKTRALQEEIEIERAEMQNRLAAMQSRVNTTNKRYKELERRRVLEVEGFTTETRDLQKKLHGLEYALAKQNMFLQEFEYA